MLILLCLCFTARILLVNFVMQFLIFNCIAKIPVSKLYSWVAPPLQGQATDIAIQAEEIVKLKKLINVIMSKHTGQSVPVIGGC